MRSSRSGAAISTPRFLYMDRLCRGFPLLVLSFLSTVKLWSKSKVCGCGWLCMHIWLMCICALCPVRSVLVLVCVLYCRVCLSLCLCMLECCFCLSEALTPCPACVAYSRPELQSLGEAV